MVSANTLLKRVLNVKDTIVKSADFFTDADGVANLKIHVRPRKHEADRCPIRDTDRLQKIGARNIDIQQNDEASQTVLDMQILESEQGMALSFDYAASRYDEETMSKFTDLFCKVSDELMRCGDANTRISEIKDRI